MKSTPRKNFLSHWMVVAAIFFLGIIAYHNCLQNEMFWDDDDFILKNRYIRDWAHFPQFFSENLVAGGYLVSNYWRPVLLTVFAWAWHTWNLWLPGWHMLNITTHIVDGILLYFLLNRLFGNRALAGAVALLFVAHPAHNEAIVYVNSLGDPLASFFVLSSLLLFVRFRQSGKAAYFSRNYLFSVLCFPLAVMSKETGFVLCGLLPMLDVILLQKDRSIWKRAKSALAAAWPFFLMALIYIVLRATKLNFSNSFNFYNEQNAFTSSIVVRLMTFFKASTQYAGFLFIPYELRVERLLPWARSFFAWDVMLGCALVGSMIFAIFRYWRERPLVAFGCAWFFIAIAPASNVLVPINAVLYEHFLYMPMIGVLLVVVDAVMRWSAPADRQLWRKGAAAVFCIYIGFFCWQNIRRNVDWHTAIGFYEQLVQYAPSYRVINNLGMEYADKGIQDKAQYWYEKAIAMDPKNPVAYHNIAGTLRDTGHLDLAEQNFKKAIELNPNFIFSYRSLAELYYRTARWEECKRYLEVLVNFDPTDQPARAVLTEVTQRLNSQNVSTQPIENK